MGIQRRAAMVDLIGSSLFQLDGEGLEDFFAPIVFTTQLVNSAMVGGQAVFQFQIVLHSEVKKNFVWCDQAIVIAIVGAEFGDFLAASPPFLQGDLAIQI